MSVPGNYFEDFSIGQHFQHATPRTVTDGDSALYIALTGARDPLSSAETFATACGYPTRPINDLLTFHIAFGKTVPDISANAIANVGYADVRFIQPVHAGDTISVESDVIGLRETSNGAGGIVYVRSTAFNQHGRLVLTWIRWVLVAKANSAPVSREPVVPALPAAVGAERLPSRAIDIDVHEIVKVTGGSRLWDDYHSGERIDHPQGMTLDESDHTFATRLYQNTAKVHFDALAMSQTTHGRRLVYGGHVISICHALSYDGLENMLGLLAINSGSHRNPVHAGDTLYCYSEVLEQIALPGREDLGALRLRLVGLRNRPSSGFSGRASPTSSEKVDEAVVLELDYTVMMPRRSN